MAVDTKAMSTGAGSGGALVPPSYGAGDKCPKCGTGLAEKAGRASCPNCGWEEPIAKALHWDASFEEKAAQWDVKELSNGTLVIEGYASTWAKDRDGDEIVKSAFDKSLPDYLNDNPVLLKDHDRHQVLGRVTKAMTDNIGLKIRAEVPRPEAGEESWKFSTYNDIKRGLRRALSIGGVFTRGKDAFKTIYEVALYEISNIAVPSNPKSLFAVIAEKGLADWEYKDVASTPAFSAQEAQTIMTEEAKAAAEGEVKLSAAEFKSVMERLDRFETSQKETAIEKAAEVEAAARIEAETKAAQQEAETKAAEAKRVSELVDAKLAAWRGGRKMVFPTDTTASAGTKAGGDESMIHLLYRKANGDTEAREKLVEMSEKAAAEYGIKALGSGSGSAGFLVPPVYWQQGIAEFRLAAAKVRQLCTVIPGIATNLVYIPRETGIASVGWTAESATKVSTDQTFGQIAVNIFTLAGISKVSRQLLEDSSPAVDMIVRKDLGRLLGQAEDIAFLAGTGSGMPTGILNTSNVLGGDLGSQSVADALAGAITAIQANYFGDPEAILIHPIHLNLLRTAKDTVGRYIFEPTFFAAASPANRAFQDNPGGLGGGYSSMPSQGGPQGTVWGLPVYADANLDTTSGEGNMIVGAFSECYVLERTGVTLDVSSEAGTSFEQNQTWFRGEERLGFTAARQPSALYVVSDMP
jgi:HK97 family phage major capsid protein/HK97 family phage prohead protease